MSLTADFNNPRDIAHKAARQRSARPAPFSMRLTLAERARLASEAGDVPLGAYIKAKVLGGAPIRTRRTGLPVADAKALAQVLGLLGGSRIANNLNQLAFAVNTGSLPVSPETEEELRDALSGVHEMRAALLRALGLRADDAP